jgi:hypothetical protein
LAPERIEELDAVVVVGIVRGADDHAEIAAEAARHVGDAGRRQRPHQQHVHAGGDETGLERRFEHVAGDARVLADQHGAALGASTRAAALASRSAKSTVIGGSPTLPRTPSVPKYFRAHLVHPPASAAAQPARRRG